jgi:Uma2 family endonuclease
MSTPSLLTADDLARVSSPDKRSELIRGRMVVREPAGFRHGDVAMAIALSIGYFLRTNPLGRLLAAETGFVLSTSPDTVRAPDVAFVRHERIPDPLPRGYARLGPDLVVEVLSPDDRPGEVLEKTADWLNAGVRLVWVIDPERRTGRVHRSDGTVAILEESDALDGEDVLPGYRSRLAEILS